MDVSQIQRILGMFTKSHVSIPIKTNTYEELYEHASVCDFAALCCKYDLLDDMLDDMLVECHKQQPKYEGKINSGEKSNECVKHIIIPKQQMQNKSIQETSHYLDKLFFALCCIKDPLMTLKGLDKSALTKMKHDLMAYVDNTQVKALDMAKYKYTKKGIREVLTKCLNVDQGNGNYNEFDWVTVRTIFVVAVRYLKMVVTLQIQGELKEHFPLPASMTQEQQHPSNNDGGIIINYIDKEFVML
jgi:hypothetical protein